ncbi:hypothetical protein WR25_24704 [Diploscapter pachys]|uniref:Uncharacterized protein n=1 Tax=Diploscapter pachys TaxID=2018661 RepID=A0A2A2L9M2_9BILA|nr:hypothetical protein WR25_24704 [Diploscapter pachys]
MKAKKEKKKKTTLLEGTTRAHKTQAAQQRRREGEGDGNGNGERNAQVTAENGGGAYGRQAGSKRWAKKETGGDGCANETLRALFQAAHKTGKDRAGELSLKMVRQAIDQHGHFVERVSRAPTTLPSPLISSLRAKQGERIFKSEAEDELRERWGRMGRIGCCCCCCIAMQQPKERDEQNCIAKANPIVGELKRPRAIRLETYTVNRYSSRFYDLSKMRFERKWERKIRDARTTALPFIAAEGSIDMVCVCYPVREFVNVSAHSRIDEIFSGAAAAEGQGQGRFLACRPYLRMKVEASWAEDAHIDSSSKKEKKDRLVRRKKWVSRGAAAASRGRKKGKGVKEQRKMTNNGEEIR